MNREQIIQMARQVGYPINHPEWQKATEEFAALVAAAEREACAKVCEEYETSNNIAATWLNIVADTIRARGNT